MPASVQLLEVVYTVDDLPLFLPVTHNFAAGECWQIIGANGVGKSTLLKIIAGVLHYEMSFSEQSVVTRVGTVAYLGHASHCKSELTARENLQWLLALFPEARRTAAEVDEALAFWGITHVAHQPFRTLSAGQKKRVMLAWLSLRGAQIWLLDEPFSALDAAAVEQLWAEIERFRAAGGVVIFASHRDWQTQPGCQSLALTPARSASLSEA